MFFHNLSSITKVLKRFYYPNFGENIFEMMYSELIEQPEILAAKVKFDEKGIEFEPVVKEANSAFKRIHGFRNPETSELISFVLNFLSEYLAAQKPKRKGMRILKAILTLGLSLWAEKRKGKR